MAFFSRNFHHPADVSFTPLFRLLDDFEAHSRQTNRGCNVRRQAQSGFQWQPKFDIREVADAYELHGELPGITKESVHIEFSDPQTLVIRGRNERTYSAGTSPHAQVEADPPASPSPSDSDKAAAAVESRKRKNSHQATVETEDEAMEHESAYEVVARDDENDKAAHEENAVQKPADKAKYWLTERSIGDFYRSFSFPSRVEQDTVTASFKDGILSISVPKAKKHESRRINIA